MNTKTSSNANTQATQAPRDAAVGCACSDCRCVECRCGTASACACPRRTEAA